jgi:hypothetical protein
MLCIAATDLNQPMLDQGKAKQAHDQRIGWRQADQTAPYPDGCFDAVACQFGVIFFPDKVGTYRGARHHFNVWDRISENGFADPVASAVAERSAGFFVPRSLWLLRC